MPAIERITRTYRHLGRYRKILAVLIRYGFGDMLGRLGVNRYLEAGRGLFRDESDDGHHHLSSAERLRLALVDLGPTFTKLGQLLSTRPDLIPIDLAQELEKLQDQAPPFPGDKARQILEEELGVPLEEVYSSFELAPLAAASLGQVHRAVLASGGQDVVVKVQRPGIRRTVATDLEILEHLTAIAERHGGEELEIQQPSAIVAEFRRAVTKELDYTTEAAHLHRFARMFADDETVAIPAVFPRFTTTRVLTMERLAGVKVSKLAEANAGAYDCERIARRGADALLRQIFEFGFFHADPHPGNILVLDGDVIGFIDLGQVGRLDRPTRRLVARLFTCLVSNDVEGATSALLDVTHSKTPAERHALEGDMSELIDWHLGRPAGEMQLARMVWRLVAIATRHRRTVAPEIFLVLKAMATVDALVRELDPAFDLPSHSHSLLRRMMLEQLAPHHVVADLWTSIQQLARLLRDMPQQLNETLREIGHGRVRLDLEHRNLESLQHTLEMIVNRLAFAIVLAALLIASSLVALGDIPPKWHGMPIIGIAGYLLSAVIGLRLLWSILKRGGL